MSTGAEIKISLQKTIKTRMFPDIIGFCKAMEKLGAKVSKRGDNTIIVHFGKEEK